MSKPTVDKFNFWMPATFEKAKDKTGKELVKISGICSSASEDSDGETLLPTGYDYSPFLKSGLLNYNHQAGKTSKAIVGEPTHAEVVNDGKDLYIEGVIYPNEEGSAIVAQQEIFEKYSPNRRFGFSIEGQAIERDPLNPKKITKARITGCAITACPKNPNTLMSIVKGKYQEAYVEDAEEDDDADDKATKKKSMDTAAIAPSTLESVDGTPKKLLSKSEVFDDIIKSYELKDFVIIKETYNFVKSVNEKMFNMKTTDNITPDALIKAKEMLNLISKGEGAAPLDATQASEPGADASTTLSKSDEALEFAKGLHAEGMGSDQIVESCIRKGFSLTESQGAATSVIAAANAAKEGGDIQTLNTDNLVKSEDLKAFSDQLTKSMEDTLSKSVSPLNDVILKGFGAVNSILDNNSKEMELVKSQFASVLERLDKVEKTPIPTGNGRTITSSAIDRFAKSQDGSAIPGSGNRVPVSISNKIQKAQLVDVMFGEFKKSNDESLANAIQGFEATNTLDEATQARFNVQLVN